VRRRGNEVRGEGAVRGGIMGGGVTTRMRPVIVEEEEEESQGRSCEARTSLGERYGGDGA